MERQTQVFAMPQLRLSQRRTGRRILLPYCSANTQQVKLQMVLFSILHRFLFLLVSRVSTTAASTSKNTHNTNHSHGNNMEVFIHPFVLSCVRMSVYIMMNMCSLLGVSGVVACVLFVSHPQFCMHICLLLLVAIFFLCLFKSWFRCLLLITD